MSEPMIAYKGFDKNMQCRGFQFVEGETYHEDKADLCNSGFHACTMPLDVLNYYSPGDGSIYRRVELDGVCDKQSNDSKICAKTIKIGPEIGIPGLVKAQIDWVKETIGFDRKVKKAKESPDKYATGTQGAASATGYQGAASTTGILGAASATGNHGAASATGIRGAASATGYQGAASATGRASAAMATGQDGRVMGEIGCAIFSVERVDGDIISVAAAIVDGEKIKAKTWYKCVGGKFVEV